MAYREPVLSVLLVLGAAAVVTIIVSWTMLRRGHRRLPWNGRLQFTARATSDVRHKQHASRAEQRRFRGYMRRMYEWEHRGSLTSNIRLVDPLILIPGNIRRSRNRTRTSMKYRLLCDVFQRPRLMHVGNDMMESVDVFQVIQANAAPVLIMGEPGAGKSVLAGYLLGSVLNPAYTHLDGRPYRLRDTPVDEWIPLYVDLREALPRIKNFLDLWHVDSARAFESWLGWELFSEDPYVPPTARLKTSHTSSSEYISYALPEVALIRKLLQNARVMIILDGLEYICHLDRSNSAPTMFVHDLDEFAAQITADGQILVAMAHPGDMAHLDPGCWAFCQLLPLLTEDQQKVAFLEQCIYYRNNGNGATSDANKITSLMNTIRHNPHIRAMTANPLMLSAAAIVPQNRLQEQRTTSIDLLASCVEELWKKRLAGTAPSAAWDDARKALAPLAYRMLNDSPIRLTCTVRELEECARENLSENPGPERLKELINNVTQGAGFLYPIEPRPFATVAGAIKRLLGDIEFLRIMSQYLIFLHFTFQEYFAYSYINEKHTPDAQIDNRWLQPQWQEVIALCHLERNDVPQWAADCLNSRLDMHKVLFLGRVLREFELRSHLHLAQEPAQARIFDNTRKQIIGYLMAASANLSPHQLIHMSMGNAAATGELLHDEDWEDIRKWWQLGDPTGKWRGRAGILHGILGGTEGITWLQDRFMDMDGTVLDHLQTYLVTLGDRIACAVINVINHGKEHRVRRWVRILNALDYPNKNLHNMLMLAYDAHINQREFVAEIVREELPNAVFHRHTGRLHPQTVMYLWEPKQKAYLDNSRAAVRYMVYRRHEITYQALLDSGIAVIIPLVEVLLDKQRGNELYLQGCRRRAVLHLIGDLHNGTQDKPNDLSIACQRILQSGIAREVDLILEILTYLPSEVGASYLNHDLLRPHLPWTRRVWLLERLERLPVAINEANCLSFKDAAIASFTFGDPNLVVQWKTKRIRARLAKVIANK